MKSDDLYCEKYRIQTDEYIDGMLDEAAAADFRAHLAECDECRAVYEAHLTASRAAAGAGEELPEGMHDRIMQAVRAESAAYRSRRLERLSRRVRMLSAGFAAVFCVFTICFLVLLLPLSLADTSGEAPQPGFTTTAPQSEPNNNYDGIITEDTNDTAEYTNSKSTDGTPEVDDSTAAPQTTADAELIETSAAPEATAYPETTSVPETTRAIMTTSTPAGTAAPPSTAAPAAEDTIAAPTDTKTSYNAPNDIAAREDMTPLQIGIIICAAGAIVALIAAAITFIFYNKLKKQKKRDIRK